MSMTGHTQELNGKKIFTKSHLHLNHKRIPVKVTTYSLKLPEPTVSILTLTLYIDSFFLQVINGVAFGSDMTT